MTETLLAFKAGRAFRREGTNFVDPSPVKGAIILKNGEDGLLHFLWKNRSTNEVEEDLILFPSDASFIKVRSATRAYVLKFSSSDQRHFFWMQDASPARDDEFVGNVNGFLEDPEFTPVWNSATSSSGATQEQLATLQALLASGTAAQNGAAQMTDVSLNDILTPANLNPLFTTHPELIPSLFPHLPPDLPLPPSAETVQSIINSPQFRAAVTNFDMALRSGQLGGLVRSMGLPDEAGTGVLPFLRAIQDQANRRSDSNDTMETD